jgi:single-strand DNA-binding protein
VSGRLQIRSYNANDGSKRYVTEVIADEVEFLTSRSEQQTMSRQPAQYSQQNRSYDQGADPFFGVPIDGFEEIDDLDVPF